MKPLVLLRAASGEHVGAGHVRRSRAVAAALTELGVDVLFVVDDAVTAQDLREEGYEVRLAQDGLEWTELGARSAWVDGFGDHAPELLRLRAAHTRTLLVENRTSARHFADLVIYPALHWEPDAWDREHASRVLGGPAWIPLQPEILATVPQPHDERDVGLLVTFGGSDPRGLTERSLRALRQARPQPVVVAVGWHMDERRGALEGLAAFLPDARVLPTGTPLGAWMARSRMALTALGTTLYELAHLGTPARILANYASDAAALSFYAAHGPHRPLGLADELDDDALAHALARALDEHQREDAHSGPAFAGGSWGGGAARIALLLLGRTLHGKGAA